MPPLNFFSPRPLEIPLPAKKLKEMIDKLEDEDVKKTADKIYIRLVKNYNRSKDSEKTSAIKHLDHTYDFLEKTLLKTDPPITQEQKKALISAYRETINTLEGHGNKSLQTAGAVIALLACVAFFVALAVFALPVVIVVVSPYVYTAVATGLLLMGCGAQSGLSLETKRLSDSVEKSVTIMEPVVNENESEAPDATISPTP